MTTDDALLGRLSLPVAPGAPATVVCKHPALRLAVVERDSVGHLSDEWDVAGVYLLLGPVAADGTYEAYVGKAALQGLRSRLKGPDHRNKVHWTRALLVARDASEAFHSAEVGWLEGRLWDLLKNAPAATLINKPQPKDETLHPSERAFLEACVGPVAGLLRVLGASPDTLDQLSAKPTRKRRRYDETVSDLIDAKLLSIGGGLHPMETKFTTVATVLGDGSLEIGNANYKAVSEAATVVAGSNRNGWDFWGVPSGSGSLVSLASLRNRLQDNAKSTSTAPASAPAAQKLPSLERTTVGTEKRAKKAAARRQRSSGETTTSLADMVADGFLSPPAPVRATFRGVSFEAVVDPQGAVVLGGRSYTPSGAGRAAKTSVAGADASKGVLATDGWIFWSAQDSAGEWATLAELRRRYVEQLPARDES
ncbi:MULTISPECIES: hypothetical protein [unclassified Actinotalea]|uniref:restriction system modified-DNA reader domain-containing protein n=1 Tax=unclassified Actinotalea TaxID=2638618 RepID=UPI0015F6199F|nr:MULTISPECIES: hypothetical protein [unclassified Actinotalea]